MSSIRSCSSNDDYLLLWPPKNWTHNDPGYGWNRLHPRQWIGSSCELQLSWQTDGIFDICLDILWSYVTPPLSLRHLGMMTSDETIIFDTLAPLERQCLRSRLISQRLCLCMDTMPVSMDCSIWSSRPDQEKPPLVLQNGTSGISNFTCELEERTKGQDSGSL